MNRGELAVAQDVTNVPAELNLLIVLPLKFAA